MISTLESVNLFIKCFAIVGIGSKANTRPNPPAHLLMISEYKPPLLHYQIRHLPERESSASLADAALGGLPTSTLQRPLGARPLAGAPAPSLDFRVVHEGRLDLVG